MNATLPSTVSAKRAATRLAVLVVVGAVVVGLGLAAVVSLVSVGDQAAKSAARAGAADGTKAREQQQAHSIFNATQLDKDWAAVAKRHGKTLAEVQAIAAQGQKEGWRIDDVGPKQSAAATARELAEERRKELVKKLESTGLLRRWTCVGNEAYVNPILWASVDVDVKKGIAATLAHSCEDQNSGDRITIYDHQSGRKLATYGALGFSVE